VSKVSVQIRTLGEVTASTNATGVIPTSKGLLRPEQFAAQVRFAEARPSATAGRWVERVWSTSWAMPPGQVRTTSLLPHPSVSLTVERGGVARQGSPGDGVWVTGVVTGRFDVTHSGTGGAVGLKFHPGGFTAWSGIAADTLTDRVVPAGELLPDVASLANLPLDAELAAAALNAFVERNGTGEDVPATVALALRLAVDPTVTRVGDLARRCGCSVRALQRMLRRYVGVGPKWVIRRQRMHDAVAELDADSEQSLADLAVRLGWYDQSQFARDFTRLVGVTPRAYRDRRAEPAHRAEETWAALPEPQER